MGVKYEIRVRGFLGPILRAAFADVQCQALARHSTIQGRLSAAELRRLMTRLNLYGVELVCVRCADEDVIDPSPGAAAGAQRVDAR